MSKGFRAATGGGGTAKDASSGSRVWLTGRLSLCTVQEVQLEASKPRAAGLSLSRSCKAGGHLGGQLLEWAGQQLSHMHTSPSYKVSLGWNGARISSPWWACPIGSHKGLWVGEASSVLPFSRRADCPCCSRRSEG